MKFLFTIQPLIGHFHPMMPMAKALKDHGHEVAFATGRSFGALVKQAGFEFYACGRDGARSSHFLTNLPGWQDLEKISHEGTRQVWCFIQGLGPRMADDLLVLLKEWKPDLIVRDPVELGGYVAAEYSGIPHASFMWSLYISPRVGNVEPLNILRQRYGLPEEHDFTSFDRYLVLNTLPPSWKLIGGAEPPAVTHRFCIPPFDQSVKRELPDWVHTLPDNPTVYATLGTTFNQQPPKFKTLITALDAETFNTIITVGQSVDPAQYHPLPSHIKIEQYIPQTMILPYCNAMLFHGGFNSLHSSIWHGLPMVVMPLEAGDQEPTARQCSELGIGIRLDWKTSRPESICAVVKAVLDQPSYRRRTQQLQDEMKRLPNLAEAVKRLVTLAGTREPQININC